MKPTRLHKALVMTGALALAAPLVPLPQIATDAWAATLPSFSTVVKKAKPAVVTVRVQEGQKLTGDMPGMPRDPQLREFFKRFFDGMPGMPGMPDTPGGRQAPTPDGEPEKTGLGSGFIVDESGLIVTNNHVIASADTITVILESGEEFEAQLVGTDEKTDLAVLRIDAGRELPTVPWGDSDAVEVGDWVLAIGNPFGLGGSVSAGIVSARGRNLQAGPYDDFIQFDAPINQGNSGGPLFDQEGNVIGVNAAILSPSGGNVGVGFATPSNMAREVTAELIQHGRVERGWIGVAIQPVTEEIAESLGLSDAEGALVASVEQGGPAQEAGIRPGDVIQGFEGTKVASLRDLTTAVAKTQPGTEAEVKVWRSGATETIGVKIREMPTEQTARAMPSEPETDLATLGLKVRPSANGLVVTRVDPTADSAAKGIRPGDIIVAVNQRPMRSLEDLNQVLEEARGQNRKSVLVLLSRDGNQRFVTVEVGAA